jgi:hypothetical protein
MEDLERILERVVQHRVDFVLVGGYAAMMHGVSLITRDVDVCTHFSRENLERLHGALADLHPYHVQTPQMMPFVIPPGFENRLRNLYIGTDWGRIDFLGDVLGVGDYETVRAQSIPVELPMGLVRMLSRQALIRAKSTLDRPRDKIAVMELRAIEERGAPEPQ